MQKGHLLHKNAQLTERENEILQLLASGASNKEIAHKLFISANTVKVHLRNIFAKIGVASRTEAAVYAIREGDSETADQAVVVPAIQEIHTLTPRPIDKKSKPFFLWSVGLVTVLLVGFIAIVLSTYQSTKIAVTSPAPTIGLQRWQQLADLPTARSGLAAVVYEDQIYAIAGETLTGVTGIVENYNPVTNSWHTKSPKPLPVTDIGAAMIGGKIFIPGGRLASGKVTNSMEIYDPNLDIWKQGTPLPVALCAYAVVTFEGQLYLFGGWDGNQYLNTVFVYNPNDGNWMTRSPMPTRRGFAGASAVGRKFYVVGGYNGTSALATIEIYNPDRDQGLESPWEKGESLPEGRFALGISSVADLIYLVGGKGDTDAILEPLLYNSRTNLWDTFEEPIFPVGHGLTLVNSGNYLYVIGGRNAQVTTNNTLSYQAIFTIMIPVIP